jgi:ketosteroid isomerase-like protein
MARGRAETVRRLFELFNQGIDDVPTELVSPEIEFASPLSGVRGRPYRGYEGARQWLNDVGEQFDRWSYEIEEVREEGETVVATGVVHLRGRASGVELDQPAVWTVGFGADGRVSELEVSVAG